MKQWAVRILAIILLGGLLYGMVAWWKASQQPRMVYRATELCEPCMKGWALNNVGEVVGITREMYESNKSSPAGLASLWAQGAGSRLLENSVGTGSHVQDINDSGQVVGLADLTHVHKTNGTVDNGQDGFLWAREQGMQRLLDLVKTIGVKSLSPVGINNQGQVVGCATFIGRDGYHAFFGDPRGEVVDLGTLGGKYSCAVDVNDQGQVIGNSEMPGSSSDPLTHAFVWEAGRGIRDLGTLNGEKSFARDINNAGQVVGASQVEGGQLQAFVWDIKTGMVGLGTLGGTVSSAAGINEAGVVVGDSALPEDKGNEVFIWEKTKGMRLLKDLTDSEDPLLRKLILKFPRAINNHAQILVEGEIPGELRNATVLLSLVTIP